MSIRMFRCPRSQLISLPSLRASGNDVPHIMLATDQNRLKVFHGGSIAMQDTNPTGSPRTDIFSPDHTYQFYSDFRVARSDWIERTKLFRTSRLLVKPPACDDSHTFHPKIEQRSSSDLHLSTSWVHGMDGGISIRNTHRIACSC